MLKIWAEERPPQAFAIIPIRTPPGLVDCGRASPPREIFTQGLMAKMTVRHMQRQPMEKTLTWAEAELEGCMRIHQSNDALPFLGGAKAVAGRLSLFGVAGMTMTTKIVDHVAAARGAIPPPAGPARDIATPLQELICVTGYPACRLLVSAQRHRGNPTAN
jgi:hypothetical protein